MAHPQRITIVAPVAMHTHKSSLTFALPPTLPRPTTNPLKRPRSTQTQTLFSRMLLSSIPQRSTQPCQSTFLLHAQRQNESPAPFWTAAGIEAMAAVLACALCRVSHLPVLGSNFIISPAALVNAAGAAIPFSLAFWALEKAPTGITAATETRFRQFFHRRAAWEVAIFCICVALGEELLFRAWLLAGLMGWGFAPSHALVVSALVFGALHAYTRIYMLLASIAGLLFGTMFLFTGSVLDPLVVHFLYDFCTILLMQRKWALKG